MHSQELNGEGVVNIRWSYEGEIPEHDGHFHLNWLKENSYSAEKLEKVQSDSRPLFTVSFLTIVRSDMMSNTFNDQLMQAPMLSLHAQSYSNHRCVSVCVTGGHQKCIDLHAAKCCCFSGRWRL